MRVRLIPLLIFAVTLGLALEVQAQVTRIWERSQANENRPTWMSENTERGMGYGLVGDNHRVFVASRAGGPNIRVLDGNNGEDAGTLSTVGIEGGFFLLNDVDTSEDGYIFACNLVGITEGDGPFKVYRWDSEAADPEVVLSYGDEYVRLGDKFTVTGSVDDGTLTIYAAASIASADAGDSRKVFRWVLNGDDEWDLTIIQMEDVSNTGIHPSVGPTAPGESDFYFNSSAGTFTPGSIQPTLYDSEGNRVGTVSGEEHLRTNSIRYFEHNMQSFVATFYGSEDDGQNALIYNVTGGPEAAMLHAETPRLGTTPNMFESGDVAVRDSDEPNAVIVYVLAGNNGVGAFLVDLTETVEGTYYVGAPGTGPDGADPDFESLHDAFAQLADAEIGGAVNLLITSDLDETGHDLFLSNVMFSEDGPLTIKPAPGVTATVRVRGVKAEGTESGNAGIGLENIHWLTIDGSSGENGESRDLTIVLDDAEAGGNGIISITRDSRHIHLENLNIRWESAVAGVAGVRMRRDNADTVVPEHIVIRNNAIGTPENTVLNGVVKFGTETNQVMTDVINNDIYASQRGVTTFWIRESTYDGNRIWVRGQRQTASWHAGVYLALATNVTIRNNEILELRSNNEARHPTGGVLINLNLGDVNIYNNIIAAPEFTNEGPGTENPVYGIGVNNAGGTGVHNIHHNTIRIGTSDQTGRVAAFGLDVASTTQDYFFSNNILVVTHDAENAYVMHWPEETRTFTADHNNLFAAGDDASIGFWRGDLAQDLVEWQVMSEQDDNSVSVDVEFVSETDLRLAGGSLEDQNLRGTEIDWITEDIDGNERRLGRPFMGAFEPPAGVPTEEPIAERPSGYELHQNYPNPFNPATVISYTLPQEGHVQIAVYDLNGRLVEQLVDGFQPSGTHEVRFDASTLASGVYLYRMVVGDYVESRRMTFVK